jgi:hypothetical protein
MRISAIVILLFLVACQGSVSTQELIGEWKYIKVESPNQYPPYVMPDEELKQGDPSIKFTASGDLVIIWGGTRLSYGKFRMENRMIRYTENLPEGAVREFPFLIKEITPQKLVFETMNKDATRVTAIRTKP